MATTTKKIGDEQAKQNYINVQYSTVRDERVSRKKAGHKEVSTVLTSCYDAQTIETLFQTQTWIIYFCRGYVVFGRCAIQAVVSPSEHTLSILIPFGAHGIFGVTADSAEVTILF